MIEIICQFIDWVIATLSASYFFHWCARGYRAIREQDVNSAVHKVESKEMITGALSLSLSLSRQRPSLNQLPSELVRLVILNLTIEEIIDFDKAISEKSPRDLWLSTLRSLRPHYWENSVGTIFSTRILQFIISREIFQTNEPIPVDIKLDSNRERPESNLNYAVRDCEVGIDMFMFRGLLLYTAIALGGPSLLLLLACSIITNNNSIAQHHHTNPNPSLSFNPKSTGTGTQQSLCCRKMAVQSYLTLLHYH